MLENVVDVVLFWLVFLIGVLAVAIIRGGDISRRLVLNDLAVNLLVSVLALLTLRRGQDEHLDSALALALLSFVGSMVVAAHALRREAPP